MPAPSRTQAPELVQDFDTFVAANRGISSGEAQQLIAQWMREYRPLAQASRRRQPELLAATG